MKLCYICNFHNFPWHIKLYKMFLLFKEDIGGPLVYNGYLIGLISYGFANETKNPGIFTRITSFTDFINGAMMRGKKMKCNKSRFYL